MSLVLTAGQRGDSPQFAPVLGQIRVPRIGPGRPRTTPDRVLADKALVLRSTPPVTGAVVSASLGALVAGFPGAVAGGVTGAVVEEVVSAYRERTSKSVDAVISWASENCGHVAG